MFKEFMESRRNSRYVRERTGQGRFIRFVIQDKIPSIWGESEGQPIDMAYVTTTIYGLNVRSVHANIVPQKSFFKTMRLVLWVLAHSAIHVFYLPEVLHYAIDRAEIPCNRKELRRELPDTHPL